MDAISGNSFSRRHRRMQWIAMTIAAAQLALAGDSFAQKASRTDLDYPVRPIRLIVTSEAGSAPDVLARILGQRLGEAFGQQVVVDNRAGAGGIIGYEIASKAQPDGYTIVMSTIALVTTYTIYRKLPYHPADSFTQIANFASLPYILVVAPSLPVTSVKQLIDFAKSQPGKLNYGSPGNGTAQHLTTELMKMQTGVNMVHIPYKSGAGAVNAILAGEAHLFFAGLPPAFPHVKTGRLRALAVTTPRRFPSVPDVPTMAEAGMPGFEVDSWQAVIGPGKIPKALVDRLNDRIVKILALPEVKKVLLTSGAEANPSTPEALEKLVRAELVKWTKAAKAAGLKPEL
jgi:tripartite-type tricarboxylate transporter receptor subunit TctC